MTTKEWDVFISHASEDKQEIVRPLADFLSQLGVKVWYDAFTLEIGDSLSRSIDKGLAESRFGLVVLSAAFFKKDWPEYELRGLIAKEFGRDKVVLPIWHNVERDQVLSFSPPLADKLAIGTSDYSVEEIALRILRVVRPDLLNHLHSRVAYEKALRSAKRELCDPRDLKISPIRHEKLPDQLICRIRLIRAALLVPYPQTMEYWLDGFKRDMHPHKEIEIWEHIAACYIEYAAVNELTRGQQQAAFSFILAIVNGADDESLDETATSIPPESLAALRDGCRSKLPIYEFKDLPSSLVNLVADSDKA